MPYYHFIWDAQAEAHLDQHGITPQEFEAVVSDPESTGTTRKSRRPYAVGEVNGRSIFCVYEVTANFYVKPITAFDIED